MADIGEKPLDDASSNYSKLVCYNNLDSQSEQPRIDGLATEIGDVVLKKALTQQPQCSERTETSFKIVH